MGDIKGFMKYERSLPSKEKPQERLKHFEEFIETNDHRHSTTQAARCMDCGVPFCHSSCPLGNVIPEFNDAVYRNEWKHAYEILTSTNNFPEFTGRICPAPCEASCVLGINNDAVAIEYIEKSVIEKAFSEDWVQPRLPQNRTDKKVAVVGSGPAGLAAADLLNQAGHSITVFEKSDRPGGLLRYGIPDFKLGKTVVERRVNLLEKEGITFKTNVNVGKDISAKELVDNYDAVLLCGGSETPRDLKIEGRNLKGIHFAMDYLPQCNKRNAGDELDESTAIQVKGKKVVVIGGGDTGSDCIGNSNRLGAESVTQIELLSKPPEERTPDNPWPLWPMTLKTSSSHEEGCEREWAINTKRFLTEDGENLSGIETVQVIWDKDENGRYSMQEVEGTARVIPCERVFLAMGFLHPMKEGMLENFSVDLDNRGNVSTEDYVTSVEKVFAAGDMRRGQSLVVWAIAEGRECAQKVNAFLEKA